MIDAWKALPDLWLQLMHAFFTATKGLSGCGARLIL